jgi:hypothetical protein
MVREQATLMMAAVKIPEPALQSTVTPLQKAACISQPPVITVKCLRQLTYEDKKFTEF